MRENGVRSVDVRCLDCDHKAAVNVTRAVCVYLYHFSTFPLSPGPCGH